jgi:hypothetical protein
MARDGMDSPFLTMTTSRLLLVGICWCGQLASADLRLGIIGTDTSHVIAFTKALNDPAAPDRVAGARVVAAYKGGSPDVKESSSRVEQFADQLRGTYGVRFADTIGDLCGQVDGILLESVDGRTHLAQMKEAVKCGKPVFIDKPLASTLTDAREIARIASAAGVPWFSASSLRYGELGALAKAPVKGVLAWGPGPFEEHQALDLSWYGIHAAEILFTLMGPGCAEVARSTAAMADVVTCRWKDGRLGSIRVDRPYSKFGAVAFRENNDVQALPAIKVDYLPLLREIVQFMATRKPPVANSETLEIFEFLDAAQRSREKGGAPMPIR